MKELSPPHRLAYKQRVRSATRVRYPLKRADWDPNGKRNTENRGKSSYIRISWEEAATLIANEIKRIIENYGSSYAILVQSDGHGQGKTVHLSHGGIPRLLQLLGGCTYQRRNPDSWEGWYWGAKHVWGMEPVGLADASNVLLDILENTEVLLCWGCDYETTTWGFGDQGLSRLGFFFSELGIKQIFICPDLNYAAAVHADKWIPVRPNTDAALQLAIAYVWITGGNYDKEYVATHTVGFEKFEDYVLGKEDGIPKTPKWAEEITGVPARIIKALAKLWASNRTSIMHINGGPMIRGPYATEVGRLEPILLAMQGVGKSGCHQLGVGGYGYPLIIHDLGLMEKILRTFRGAPLDWQWFLARLSRTRHEEVKKYMKQFIPRVLIPDAILNPPINWYGHTGPSCPTECQFDEYKYPVNGLPEVHMIWSDSPCWTTCWNGGYKMIEALRSPKIEFILVQHPWLENDCLFADVILPVTTPFEENDILLNLPPDNSHYGAVVHSAKCIDSIGESKSDYEICCMIAEKLEKVLGMPGLVEKFTEGRSVEDWIRWFFEESGVSEFISFEEWKNKGYWLLPVDPQWKKHKPYLSLFYQDAESFPLKTPSGKIEIYSERLAKHFTNDKERPPLPHWIPYGETWHESLLHPRAKDYPFLLISNHPRWRMHAQLNDVAWFHEIPTCKVSGPDGYLYEPVWINRLDAQRLGIKHGNVVMVYNERGTVLGGAYLTERIIPGTVYMEHGASVDLISLDDKIDRGGAINLIAPKEEGKTAALMVVSGYLVNVKKADLEELKKRYPKAFERAYHAEADYVRSRM
jgi:trimethylamine-N-oxide reductase (cytochrome c)